jgi:hypothetical protein
MSARVTAPTVAGMEHPNVARFREAHTALVAGDVGPTWALMREDFVNVNDVGAGPWREQRGPEAMMRFWGEWAELFDGTFRQEILHAVGYDDRVVLIVHETGTVQGQAFDNRAIYVIDVDDDGRWTALRTMDMDHEKIRRFWAAVTLPEGVGVRCARAADALRPRGQRATGVTSTRTSWPSETTPARVGSGTAA